MKKIIKLLLLSLTFLMLTGCLDILHTVSLHKGKADITVRFTIDKTLMELGSSFSGEEFDDSGIMGMGDAFFEEFNGLPAEIIPINTTSQMGAELRFSGRLKELEDQLEGVDFLPLRKGDGYEISIPGMGDEGLEDENSQAFLSGSRYMLLVDLSGDLKDMKRARLILPEGMKAEGDDMLVNIYGSSMLIEISMKSFFNTKESIIVELLP